MMLAIARDDDQLEPADLGQPDVVLCSDRDLWKFGVAREDDAVGGDHWSLPRADH
jgi:hypothetical protein